MSAVRAAGRWIRADLRARRGQAALSVLAVAGIVTALIASANLLADGTNPWRRLFSQSKGAHVWVYTQHRPADRDLARVGGVRALAGPYRTASVTVNRDGLRAPAALWGIPGGPPSIGRPLIRQGRWPAASGEVVVERSFARALRLRVGASFELTSPSGAPHRLVVSGLADSANQGFYPEWTPGLAWVGESTLARIEPAAGRSQWVSGLRLDHGDENATRLAVQSVVTRLDEQVQRVSTWRQVRASMELDNRLLGLLLALFGGVGLVAAVIAVVNVVGGRVLIHVRDLATLKALGMTRRQITTTLVVEHGALGVLGVALGLACGHLLVALVLDALPVPSANAAVGAGTVVVVLVAAGLPAWQGGRTRPVPAEADPVPRGRLSRLARVALLVRLPAPLVLGARNAFGRRGPALLTVFGVAVPMMMITVGLGCWATLDDFRRHPERVGMAAALSVRPGRLPPEQAEQLLRADPGVTAVYPGSDVDVLEANQTRSVLARAVGTAGRPYPFTVVEGRPIAGRGEAVAGQGLLDLMEVRIGDRIRITVGGAPLILRVVGRVIEPERDGEVLSFGFDTLTAREPLAPEFYRLALRPGADPGEVRARLLAASGQGLEVRRTVNPADRLSVIRLIIVALAAVLTLIGLANVLTAGALGLRDHARDLALLKAMGMTPRQVALTLVTGTGLLIVLGLLGGAAAGTLLGPLLIDAQARSSGVGAGIARAPSAALLAAAVVVATGIALLVTAIPARRAAAARVPHAAR